MRLARDPVRFLAINKGPVGLSPRLRNRRLHTPTAQRYLNVREPLAKWLRSVNQL